MTGMSVFLMFASGVLVGGRGHVITTIMQGSCMQATRVALWTKVQCVY